MSRAQSGVRSGVTLRSSILTSLILLIGFLLFGTPGEVPDRTLPDPGAPTSSTPYSPVPIGALDPSVLRGKVIVVDPGHGGVAAGSVGVGPTPEKENVLAVGLRLEQLLERAGARVIMTRTGDTLPGGSPDRQLEARVAMANEAGADVFVSIHNDWNDESWITGTTTYYYSKTSERLAHVMQQEIIRSLGSRDNEVRYAPFYVVRYTNMPSVLIELGFLSNYEEAMRLSQPDYRQRAALGIYNGLVRYFQ